MAAALTILVSQFFFTIKVFNISFKIYRMNTSRIRSLASPLIVFLCFISAAAEAASSSLNPSADAFVANGPTGNLSINNYGGAGALSIAAPNLSQGEFQSVLQFNLAGVKSTFDAQFGVGQWSLQSVSLQLTATAPNNAIFNGSAAGQFSVSW